MKRAFVCLLIVVSLGVVTYSVGVDNGIVRHYPLNSNGTNMYNTNSPSAMYLDFSQDPSGATITAGGSSAFVLTKGSDPDRVSDFTIPAGPSGTRGYAHYMDGDDYYVCANETCNTLPTGSFTLIAVVTPFSVTGTQYLIAKYQGIDGKRSYGLYMSTASASFIVSKNGNSGAGSSNTTTRSGCFAIGRTSIVIATYTYVADGTSVADVYCDNLAVTETTSVVGPIYDSGESFDIAANSAEASPYTGLFHHAEYIPGKAMTSTEVSTWMKTYRGMTSTTGNFLSTTCATCPGTLMAPPDSGVEPFIIRNPANTSWVGNPASGQSGVFNCPAITNYAQRTAICETPDGSNHPTGWTVAETDSDVSCSTASKANGSQSVKIIHDNAADVSTITSGCLTEKARENLYVELYAKDSGGTSEFTINFLEYGESDCGAGDGGLLATTALVSNQNLSSSWAIVGALMAQATWNAATDGWKIQVVETGTDTVYFDVPTVTNGTVSTLNTFCSCTSDADASAACNSEYVTMADNPIRPGGTCELSFDFYGNWVGNDSVAHYFFYTGGTTANDILIDKASANNLACRFYDTGGTGRTALEAVNDTDWAAATKHAIKCTRTSVNNVYGSLNGTAFSTPTTDGSAIQNAIDTSVTFGSTTQSFKGVLSNFIFRRRATQ